MIKGRKLKVEEYFHFSKHGKKANEVYIDL